MPLVDAKGRTISYLRVSLTDRCNYRCSYCMPPQGFELAAREAVLSLEETVRVVRVFAGLGVTAVRLTGGEPTVRRGVVDFVRAVARVPGIEDVAMTTNGATLGRLAAPLKEAGLTRLNVSLDTLDETRFHTLTRGGRLGHVLDGLDAAREAGFSRIKINSVLIRGVNDDEARALCRFAWRRGFVPRFIELMPLGEAGRFHGRDAGIPTAELMARLEPLLEPVGAPMEVAGRGPAVYRARRGHPDQGVGFIGAVSEKFCAGCNRVRLTSEGRLRGCLARPEGADLRALLRSGASDDALADAIDRAVLSRKDGHAFWDGDDDPSRLVVMTGVGG